MADAELVLEIERLLKTSPFHGEGYRKVWARLRFEGIHTSRRRVLRLMREHQLLAHQRAGRPRGPRAHDGTITTERVDEMWGTDMTAVMTGEGQAAVFIAVDHCSAECTGIHAAKSGNRFEALEPVKQAVGRKDTPCRKMPLSASGDEAGQSRMNLCFVCCARERGEC